MPSMAARNGSSAAAEHPTSPGGEIEILSADQVAELLQLRRSTVMDLARRGELPSIRLGRHVRFLRADVVDWIIGLRARNGRAG